MSIRYGLVVAVSIGVGVLIREPSWYLARVPGHGCWPPRCRTEDVPLATPILSHANRLFMIGDGAAPTSGYESMDGVRWREFQHDARWGIRYKAADVSFRGALWRVGGFVQDGPKRTLMNDVWRSVDGRRWEAVLENAPWAPRSNAHLVVLRDTMWLIGGTPTDGTLWRTIDGRNWSAQEVPARIVADLQGVVVYHDAVWVIGHGEWDAATTDVWSSMNGKTWTRITAAAPWPPRTGAGFAVFDDRLWVLGGINRRDAWWSSDGRAWHRLAGDIPGPARAGDYSVVFRNALWIYGGKTGGQGGTGFWDGVAYLR
jgi:hypothetical protein